MKGIVGNGKGQGTIEDMENFGLEKLNMRIGYVGQSIMAVYLKICTFATPVIIEVV